MSRDEKIVDAPIAIAPRRLCETDRVAGRLIREVLEQDAAPMELAAGEEVRREALRRRGRGRSRIMWGAAAAAAALLWLVSGRSSPSITSESISALLIQQEATENAASETDAASSASAEKLSELIPPEPREPVLVKAKPEKSKGGARKKLGEEEASAKKGESPDVKEPADCSSLASTDHQAALRCFRAAASGSGVSSEFALLEMSRLYSRALGDRQAALNVLDEYRRKYPSGALRREAALARVDHLLALGSPDAALAATLEARDSVPDQRVRLNRVAGELLVQLGRCDEIETALIDGAMGDEEKNRLLSLASSCR